MGVLLREKSAKHKENNINDKKYVKSWANKKVAHFSHSGWSYKTVPEYREGWRFNGLWGVIAIVVVISRDW